MALAQRVGPAEAARQLGLGISTVTGWQSKARRDPDSFAVDADEIDDSVDDELPAEPLTPFRVRFTQALEESFTLAQEKFNAAMLRDDDRASNRYAVAYGVAADKVRMALAADPAVPRFDLATGAGRDRIAHLCQSCVEMVELTQLHGLAKADDRGLDMAQRQRYAVERRMHNENRWLAEERRRRAAGEPSLFDSVAGPPSGTYAPIPPKITKPSGVTPEQRDPRVIAEHFDGKIEEGRRASVLQFARGGRSVRDRLAGLRPQDMEPQQGA